MHKRKRLRGFFSALLILGRQQAREACRVDGSNGDAHRAFHCPPSKMGTSQSSPAC